MGRTLQRSVEDYNALVGALERRVLVTARRMHDLELVERRPARGRCRSSMAPARSPRPSCCDDLARAPELVDDARPGAAR